LPLLRNPQSCDRGHTTARRRAVKGGPRRAFPPTRRGPCGRRHAWGVPPVTLNYSPDFPTALNRAGSPPVRYSEGCAITINHSIGSLRAIQPE
jgi:hypothetical protein